MKVAILILLAFFLYRYFRKKGAATEGNTARYESGYSGRSSYEEMVEDPYCKTFIQKGTAIKARHGNRTYYFCSKKCRDKYLAEAGRET